MVFNYFVCIRFSYFITLNWFTWTGMCLKLSFLGAFFRKNDVRTNIFVQNMNAFRELNLFKFKENIFSPKNYSDVDLKMNIINSQRQKDKTYREQLLIFNSAQRNSPQNTRGGTTATRPRPLTSQSAHSTAFNSFLNLSDYFQYASYTGRREAPGLFILIYTLYIWTGSTGTDLVEPHLDRVSFDLDVSPEPADPDIKSAASLSPCEIRLKWCW